MGLSYNKLIKDYKPLSKEDEKYHVLEAKSGNKDSRQILIESNLKFVVSIAKHFQGGGLSLDELISAGNLGLIKAVDKLDPKKGCHVITYAKWWIKQAIFKELSKRKGHEISLQSPVGEYGCQLEEIIPDKREKTLNNFFEQEFVRTLLKQLPQRSSDILKHSFGVCGEKCLTLKQIAEKYEISSNRVRQIKDESIANLKKWNRDFY